MINIENNFTNFHINQQKQKMIYLWYFYINKLLPKYRKFYETLLPSEKSQVSKLVFHKDKERFVISHGALRELLLKHLPPECLTKYEYNYFGKPYLKNSALTFNLSHSNNVGVCILSYGINIGVDVEYSRNINWQDIANHTLSRDEMSHIYAIKGETKKLNTIINIWTQKEAVAKAIGRGLSIPFTNITSSPCLGKHISFYTNSNKIEKWNVYSFLLNNHYFISAAYDYDNVSLSINELI